MITVHKGKLFSLLFLVLSLWAVIMAGNAEASVVLQQTLFGTDADAVATNDGGQGLGTSLDFSLHSVEFKAKSSTGTGEMTMYLYECTTNNRAGSCNGAEISDIRIKSTGPVMYESEFRTN